MKRGKNILVLILAVTALVAVNYDFLDKTLEGFLAEGRHTQVTRIIDGDTIEINGNESVRLLGINTPERGEKYYQEAKEFLEMVVLNKTINLKFGKDKYDRYGRLLAYVFFNEVNVNKELVDEGYANIYFPEGKDEYYNSLVKAWAHCIKNNKYLCEKSEDKCAECVEVKELDAKNDRAVLHNKCSFSCDLSGWTIKDEGRKRFAFPDFTLRSNKEVSIITGNNTDTGNTLFWKKETYVWTETGDTLFLRDKEGKLVVWRSY